jgi:hypothetical protein
MSLTVTPLQTDGFASSLALDGDVAVLSLTGCADLKVWRGLGEMLVELHDEARRLEVKRVVVDVRELEFMNSSCFKSIVSWLNSIMELEPDQQYKIHFRSNPERLWQRRSLHALRSFALMLVTIES